MEGESMARRDRDGCHCWAGYDPTFFSWLGISMGLRQHRVPGIGDSVVMDEPGDGGLAQFAAPWAVRYAPGDNTDTAISRDCDNATRSASSRIAQSSVAGDLRHI